MSDNRSRYSSAPLQNLKKSTPKRSSKPQPPRTVGDYQDAAIPQRSFSALQILLTIILPLIFIVSLLVRSSSIYILFAVISAACLLLMWLLNAFVPNARMTLSFIHIAMILVALFAVWMSPPSAPASTAPNTANNSSNVQEGDLASIFAKNSSASMVDMTQQQQQSDFTVVAATSNPGAASMAQQRLDQFMTAWISNDYKGMVNLSLPAWVSQQQNAEQAMFYVRGIRMPVSYEFKNVSGSDADNTRTIDMVAAIDKSNGQAPRSYLMQVLMMRINDIWYVDPTSLSSDQEIRDSSSTAVPQVTIAPMVTGVPSLQLYYNAQGGLFYHVDPNCISIKAEYLPLTSGFLFSQVNDPQFSQLQPCTTCHAPGRV